MYKVSKTQGVRSKVGHWILIPRIRVQFSYSPPFTWLYRLVVRTQDSLSCNQGSNPCKVTNNNAG